MNARLTTVAALEQDLFAPVCVRLVDDAEGGVRYWPRFVDADIARAWFDALHAGAAWAAMRRPMYDRIVEVPRLLAQYAIDALPGDLPLASMLARVQAQAPAPYTRIGLNLYRDGGDSVAMHHDSLRGLRPGQPITLVSLGAPRRMLLRTAGGGGGTIAVDLAPGSLLRMSHASQRTHEHGIPKCRHAAGPRISVVFRAGPVA